MTAGANPNSDAKSDRSAASKQGDDRTGTTAVRRRLAVREHVVPLREPAPHLALQHRLAIAATSDPCRGSPARSESRGCGRRGENRRARRGPPSVVMPCRSMTACTTQCPRRSLTSTSRPSPRRTNVCSPSMLLPDVPALRGGLGAVLRQLERLALRLRCAGAVAARAAASPARRGCAAACARRRRMPDARSMSASACPLAASRAPRRRGLPARPISRRACAVATRGRRPRTASASALASSSALRSESFATVGGDQRGRAPRVRRRTVSRNTSASSAAMQPVPAEVTAWR